MHEHMSGHAPYTESSDADFALYAGEPDCSKWGRHPVRCDASPSAVHCCRGSARKCWHCPLVDDSQAHQRPSVRGVLSARPCPFHIPPESAYVQAHAPTLRCVFLGAFSKRVMGCLGNPTWRAQETEAQEFFRILDLADGGLQQILDVSATADWLGHIFWTSPGRGEAPPLPTVVLQCLVISEELTKYREEQRRLREEAATKIEKAPRFLQCVFPACS